MPRLILRHRSSVLVIPSDEIMYVTLNQTLGCTIIAKFSSQIAIAGHHQDLVDWFNGSMRGKKVWATHYLNIDYKVFR